MENERDQNQTGHPNAAETRRARVLELIKKVEAKEEFRFAVGSEEAGYSAMWVAKANKGDYYITPKSTGGALKISFHPPNNRMSNYIGRMALDSDFLKKRPDLGIKRAARAYTEWRRFGPPAEGGNAAAVIIFPTNGLRGTTIKLNRNKPAFVFSPAPRDMAVEVWFIHTKTKWNIFV